MTDNIEKKKILLTGASGFLGSYIKEALDGFDVLSLGRGSDNDVQFDVASGKGAFPAKERFDAVIHAAGTTDEALADAVNNQGTINLLKQLEVCPPRHFTLLSSVHVYGLTPGEGVTEDTFLRPDTAYARSKIRAEKECEKWCAEHGVELTILRVALTAGKGMHGALSEMSEGVRRGIYFHISGNQAKRSVVMADDVASAVRLTLDKPGIYNVCDGADRTVVELADAMTANFGTNKRLLTMPRKPLKLMAKLHKGLAYKVGKLTTSVTFSNKKIVEATGMTFYDTVEVIARRHPDYPYRDE